MTKEKNNKHDYTMLMGKENMIVLKNKGRNKSTNPWCWESFPMDSCLKEELSYKRYGLISSTFGWTKYNSLIPWGEASFIGQQRWGRDERIKEEGWGGILLRWIWVISIL